jgi:hypothetical protein
METEQTRTAVPTHPGQAIASRLVSSDTQRPAGAATTATRPEGEVVITDPDYYARMLPERDRPVEALGGVLNGIGAALGVFAIFILPALLGTAGILVAGASLAMARERETARRFGIGFAVAALGWLIGLGYAVWKSKALWP